MEPRNQFCYQISLFPGTQSQSSAEPLYYFPLYKIFVQYKNIQQYKNASKNATNIWNAFIGFHCRRGNRSYCATLKTSIHIEKRYMFNSNANRFFKIKSFTMKDILPMFLSNLLCSSNLDPTPNCGKASVKMAGRPLNGRYSRTIFRDLQTISIVLCETGPH